MPIPQNVFRNTACACGCSDGGIKVRTAGALCLSPIRAARYDWGGRRLNVPVTRSRQEIIIVTSIPLSAYRTPAPLPDGKQPNGAWYLFSYLKYAELLQKLFEEDWNKQKEALTAKRGEVKTGASEYTSLFCEALADFPARNFQISSEVYWGSDGFCIDLALHHPIIPNDVTIGVLCDGMRFGKAPDAAEWDAFRTIVLASQGWDIHRIWTPHFLRYPDQEFKRLQKSINAVLNPEKTEVPEKQVYSDN